MPSTIVPIFASYLRVFWWKCTPRNGTLLAPTPALRSPVSASKLVSARSYAEEEEEERARDNARARRASPARNARDLVARASRRARARLSLALALNASRAAASYALAAASSAAASEPCSFSEK